MSTRDLQPTASPRKPRITSFGELLWDIFPDSSFLGGSAANVAFQAARLGADSRLISRVGDDLLGKKAIAQLDEAGVCVKDISLDPEKPTGTVAVRIRGGEPIFTIAPDVAWDAIEPSQAAISQVFSSDIFCFGTLAGRGEAVHQRLMNLLKDLRRLGPHRHLMGEEGARPLCIFDLNLRPPHLSKRRTLESLALADVIKMNEEESAWLEELSGSRDVNAWLLESFNLRLIALTRGNRGAALHGREIHFDVEGKQVAGGDPVGAGDSFVACLAVGLAANTPLPQALSQANDYASWVASQHGAMPFQRM